MKILKIHCKGVTNQKMWFSIDFHGKKISKYLIIKMVVMVRDVKVLIYIHSVLQTK